jgi:choline dehydrogenase-like flavoprotein
MQQDEALHLEIHIRIESESKAVENAGTLWMGTNPGSSVTDTNGRFHHISNAFCADQSLFVTAGSVNPTLTGLVLSRKVAEAAVALGTGAPPPP